MNRWTLCLYLFILTVAIAINPVMAHHDNIEVISPPDMASVSGKLINIVYRIKEDSFDTIRITSDYSSARVLPEPVAKFGIRHSSIFLSEGENRIRIQGLHGKKVVAEKILTVFLISHLVEEYVTAPPGFKKYIFHTRNNEKACNFCHAEELCEDAKSQQDAALPSCYTCHKRIVDYEFVHGPASVWACDTCHKENSKKIKNAVPDREAMLCQMCHTEELAAWQSEKFGHGPTLAGKCAFCHNPHGSDEMFFLTRSPSVLCGYCHQDKLTDPHVITGFYQTGHPMNLESGKNGKRGITCVSCHNPHAENNVNLLIGFKQSKRNLCLSCHP
jgi:predicted CXXCH cytochrome family protein